MTPRETSALDTIAALPCWTGPVMIEPLPGGLTNRNFRVRDGGTPYVVRLAGDVAGHGIDRAAERAATIAAAAIGLGPRVHHAAPGALVLEAIEGRTLAAADLADPHLLAATLDLLRRVAGEMPGACPRPWRDRRPAAILAAYAAFLADAPEPWRGRAARHADRLAALAARPPEAPSFVHGDIHAGNLIDDGRRLWLVDWEYAGAGAWGQDAASLLSNGPEGADARFGESILAGWLGRGPTSDERARFRAQRLGAALRDLFWGYAQSVIDPAFDGAEYLRVNEARVGAASAGI